APYAALIGLFASVVLVALAAQRAQRLAAEAAVAGAEPAAPVPAPRSEESLPEDAYAPARAYEPAEQPALVTNPGPTPLWPTTPRSRSRSSGSTPNRSSPSCAQGSRRSSTRSVARSSPRRGQYTEACSPSRAETWKFSSAWLNVSWVHTGRSASARYRTSPK